jgi:hypothetical protein
MRNSDHAPRSRDDLLALARDGSVLALPRGLREQVIGAVIEELGGEEATRVVTGFPPPRDVAELHGPLRAAAESGELVLEQPGLGLLVYLLGARSRAPEHEGGATAGRGPVSRLVGDAIERAWRECRTRRSVEICVSRLWSGEHVGEQATLALSLDARALVLQIEAVFHDDPPPTAPPGSCWALWEHEVVELFLLGEDDHYTEIEIGPYGHFLVLQLEGRRNITARDLPLTIDSLVVDRARGRWRATARLDAAFVPSRPLWYNAYAIHGRGAARRYLAHAPVPGPAPDFHRLESFRLFSVDCPAPPVG